MHGTHIVAQSFSQMLNLANLAEEVQICRRRRNKAVMQIMLWICTRKNNFMTICTNDAITIFLYDFVVKVRSLQADCLSVALQLLLKLKRHLKIMYSLDEAHCQHAQR
ncbi:uncharacterized protein LOC106768044 isoform X3 [Vigna radiata var. radiata]|uniref:Uncharacterized protein LOC106768044 isoform X3 n=1 Tax=Vigna radiata var. radiata TaxID=3916 RepID=A0A3Q0F8E8_VIGRR|nr:uncharacterized protein LOC106768044 isoform X3 [Vigna radiata var. radiata]